MNPSNPLPPPQTLGELRNRLRTALVNATTISAAERLALLREIETRLEWPH